MRATKQHEDYKELATAAARKSIATQRKTIIDGRTKAELTAEKIRNANLKIDENGLSGYQKASRKAAPKVRATNVINGNWIPDEQQSAFRKYELSMKRATGKFDLATLKNYHLRGPCGTVGSFNIDHRFSVHEGFLKNIPPEIIGHICNLEMKPWEQNLSKWKRCDITLDELLEAIEIFERTTVTSMSTKKIT
jgi:hypothetical protein